MAISNKNLICNALETRMLRCVTQYEAIKTKTSTEFKMVKDFCKFYGFSRQNFLKIYNRYKQNPVSSMLVPQKRGPSFKFRRTDISVEDRVAVLRKQLLNRYEIVNILLGEVIKISPSTVYNIFKRCGLNKLNCFYSLPKIKSGQILVTK